MKISYRAADFRISDPALSTGFHDLRFTPADLVRAAITVGRKNVTDILQHGDFSILELIWRTAMLLSAVEHKKDDSLVWSPSYHGLDPSERGAVSYFVGMVFAKLMSERLLQTPWLLHLDVYEELLSPQLLKGEERPDLVGYRTDGTWLAVESKGGAGNLKTRGWDHAKAQLANLASVDSKPIDLRVASVTFQRRKRGIPFLHVEFRDPPAAEEGFNLPINADRLIADYYRWIRRLIGERPELLDGLSAQTGTAYIGRYIPEVELSIGIPEELFRANPTAEIALRNAMRGSVPVDNGYIEQTRRVLHLNSIGPDAVAVELSEWWSDRFRP